MGFGQVLMLCVGLAAFYWLIGLWLTHSSGWHQLARAYATKALFFHGERWSFQWAAMAGNRQPFASRSPLRLDVRANADGLRLEVSLFFLPWFSLAPPLFVPWSEVRAGYVFMKHVPWEVVELSFARAPQVPFRIREELAAALAGRVGSAFRWTPPPAEASAAAERAPTGAGQAAPDASSAMPTPAGSTMRCPKCGLEQARSPECAGCHVLVARYVPGGPRGAFRERLARAQFGKRLAAITPHTWATPTIAAANVAVFVLMLLRGAGLLAPTTGELIAAGANYGPLTSAGEPWRLFSSMFVHVGVVHLLFNMLVLAQVGVTVERLMGSAGMLAVYLVSGLLGSEASAWRNPTVVSAGASGAVFGLQGAVLGILVRDRASIPPAVLKPLLQGTLLFLAFNVLYGLGRPGIDMAAHIGGLAGGLVCGLAVGAHLTERGAGGRRLRAAGLVAGGLAVVALGAARLPQAFDVLGETAALARADELVLQAYGAGLRDWRAGRLTDATLADLIETRVLGEWRSCRRHLDGLLTGPPRAGQDRVLTLWRYAASRQESWERLVQALRGGDSEVIEDALRAEAEDRAGGLGRRSY